RLDGNIVLLDVGEELRPRAELPLAPGRDDLHIGLEMESAELEADLVVALAGRAVGDGVGAEVLGRLHEPLDDAGPSQRGAEQVLALVDGGGAERGPHEIGDEGLAAVLDDDLARAGAERLLAREVEVFLLPDV